MSIRSRKSFTLLVSAPVIAVAVAFQVGPASAETPAPPPGLTGEYTPGTGFLYGTSSSVDCDVNGTSTLTFAASGLAAGPYPGTWTEQGTVTFSAPFLPRDALYGTVAARLTSFDVTFQIDSPVGQVSGTKHLTGTEDVAFGLCGDAFVPPTAGQGYARAYGMRYDAVITTPDGGRYGDSGTVNSEVSICPPNSCTTSADEIGFLSQGVVRLAPTSKEDCKKGGYLNYPALGFKNQGDCVSYVATGGKNPPAGT